MRDLILLRKLRGLTTGIDEVPIPVASSVWGTSRIKLSAQGSQANRTKQAYSQASTSRTQPCAIKTTKIRAHP